MSKHFSLIMALGIPAIMVMGMMSCEGEKDHNPDCRKLKVVQTSGLQIITYYADSVAWESDLRYSLWVDEEDEPIMEQRIEEDWSVSTELSDCYRSEKP